MHYVLPNKGFFLNEFSIFHSFQNKSKTFKLRRNCYVKISEFSRNSKLKTGRQNYN